MAGHHRAQGIVPVDGQELTQLADLGRSAGEAVKEQAAATPAPKPEWPDRLGVRGRIPDRSGRAEGRHVRQCTVRKFTPEPGLYDAGVITVAIVGWIIALALGIGLALFAVQNQGSVPISFWGVPSQVLPVWSLVLASAAVGALMVGIIAMIGRLRLYLGGRHNRKVLTEHKRMIVERDNRIHELEQEIFRLRGAA